MALKYDWSTIGELAEQAARSRAHNEATSTLGVDLPVDAALFAAVAELLAGGIGGGGGGGGPITAADVGAGQFPAGSFAFPGPLTVNGQTVDGTTVLSAAQKTALTSGGNADAQHTHSTFGSGITVTGGITGDTIAVPLPVRTVTVSLTIAPTDRVILVDATAGPVTVTLLSATAFGKAELFVKKIDSSANAVTVAVAGADTIDGAATATLTSQYASTDIISDGVSKWSVALASSGGGGSITAANVGAGTYPAGNFHYTSCNVFVDGSGGSFTCGSSTPATFSNSVNMTGQVYYRDFNAGNSGTALTLNASNGIIQHATLTGNVVLTLSGLTGVVLTIRLVQDATGGRTVTWPASVKWAGGTSPTQTTTAAKSDIYQLYYDGTNWWGRVLGQNY